MIEEILEQARGKGSRALSEFESKKVIESAGVPITREDLAKTKEEAISIARKLGYPVVLKGCSDKLTHKTELGVIKLGLESDEDVEEAYEEIITKASGVDGVLVQEMVHGDRELVIGLSRDPQFGPCVMFGLGGIYTEALSDVAFRVAPITEIDAREMIEEIRTKKIMGEFRGSPAVNTEILIKALVGISELGKKYDEIAEIDINPIIVSGNKPVAVDALVVLS